MTRATSKFSLLVSATVLVASCSSAPVAVGELDPSAADGRPLIEDPELADACVAWVERQGRGLAVAWGDGALRRTWVDNQLQDGLLLGLIGHTSSRYGPTQLDTSAAFRVERVTVDDKGRVRCRGRAVVEHGMRYERDDDVPFKRFERETAAALDFELDNETQSGLRALRASAWVVRESTVLRFDFEDDRIGFDAMLERCRPTDAGIELCERRVDAYWREGAQSSHIDVLAFDRDGHLVGATQAAKASPREEGGAVGSIAVEPPQAIDLGLDVPTWRVDGHGVTAEAVAGCAAQFDQDRVTIIVLDAGEVRPVFGQDIVQAAFDCPQGTNRDVRELEIIPVPGRPAELRLTVRESTRPNSVAVGTVQVFRFDGERYELTETFAPTR